MSLNGNATQEKVLRGRINPLDTLTLSAYAIAVKNGFEGTEAEWLESLKGEKGEKGEPGVPGARGEKGEKGEKGDPGVASITDRTTGTNYSLYVENGELKMEVAK